MVKVKLSRHCLDNYLNKWIGLKLDYKTWKGTTYIHFPKVHDKIRKPKMMKEHKCAVPCESTKVHGLTHDLVCKSLVFAIFIAG